METIKLPSALEYISCFSKQLALLSQGVTLLGESDEAIFFRCESSSILRKVKSLLETNAGGLINYLSLLISLALHCGRFIIVVLVLC